MSDFENQESIDIDSLDGHDFEALIVRLFEKMGFVIAERKLSADGGIDIEATNNEPLMSGTYIIQCKRFSSKVGEPILRDLYGVVHSTNANKGLLITNSKFTSQAKKFAEGKQLELVDGDKMRSLLIQHKILHIGKDYAARPNSIIYIRNSFIPKLRKIQKEYNDVNDGLTYIDRKSFDQYKYFNYNAEKLTKVKYYVRFLKNNFNECFGEISLQNDDVNHTKEAAKRIIEATQKFLNDYTKVLGVIPQKKFEIHHEKVLAIYKKIFATLWLLVDELESATKEARPQNVVIDLTFDIRNEVKQLDQELDRLLEKKKQEKQSNCFIATAAYGSPLATEINILRKFRDNKMLPNAFGNANVKLYYHLSPSIANIISCNNKMKKITRFFIDVIIRKITKKER